MRNMEDKTRIQNFKDLKIFILLFSIPVLFFGYCSDYPFVIIALKYVALPTILIVVASIIIIYRKELFKEVKEKFFK